MSLVRTISGGESKSAKKPCVISVTSGKGGVGKTLTTVNFALAARRLGKSVLILDGDLGLANVDVVLGLKTKNSLREVLDGHCQLKDIIVTGPMGLEIIPSGSGIASLTMLSHAQKQSIFDQIDSYDEHFDVLIIDTGAGITDNVLTFNHVADERVVVTTPEPHAMTDAYALIKVMSENYGDKAFKLLVNLARTRDEGLKVAERIAEVALRFLDVQVEFVGHVPVDPQVPKSVMQRRAASEESTFTISGQAWSKIARSIIEGHGSDPQGKFQDFWRELLWTEPYSKQTRLSV